MRTHTRMRSLVPAAATLALVAAGLPATATAEPTLVWGACQEPRLVEAGAQCAVVSVPLDSAKPGGPSVPIAISRIAATATGADYLGPLFSNPGGPGGSGLGDPADLATLLSSEVAGRFDLIGFDPRGVGASGPKLQCDPGHFTRPSPDYLPPDPARVTGSEARRLAETRAYVTACRKSSGDALNHLRTVDVAGDLERIRAALGSPTLSFVGNSYGTYLGQVYATTFPTRVARMVLAGVVPPNGAGYTGDVSRPEVARAYERNINAFFAWVGEHDAIYRLGADGAAVRERFYADRDALRRAPRNGIGPAEWVQLFGSAVYSDGPWALLAQGWSGWTAGRTAIFEGAFAGSDPVETDAFTAAFLAVACSDGPWPRSYDRLRADSLRTARSAPFITWALHWELSTPCSTWPSTGTRQRVGSATPSMLLVNGTMDAPTPFADALATRAAFPRSALIEVTASLRHAGGSLWGNPCVQQPVEHYLLTGELPARTGGAGPDLQCAGAPRPGYPEIALAAAGEVALPLLSALDGIAGPPGRRNSR